MTPSDEKKPLPITTKSTAPSQPTNFGQWQESLQAIRMLYYRRRWKECIDRCNRLMHQPKTNVSIFISVLRVEYTNPALKFSCIQCTHALCTFIALFPTSFWLDRCTISLCLSLLSSWLPKSPTRLLLNSCRNLISHKLQALVVEILTSQAPSHVHTLLPSRTSHLLHPLQLPIHDISYLPLRHRYHRLPSLLQPSNHLRCVSTKPVILFRHHLRLLALYFSTHRKAHPPSIPLHFPHRPKTGFNSVPWNVTTLISDLLRKCLRIIFLPPSSSSQKHKRFKHNGIR